MHASLQVTSPEEYRIKRGTVAKELYRNYYIAIYDHHLAALKHAKRYHMYHPSMKIMSGWSLKLVDDLGSLFPNQPREIQPGWRVRLVRESNWKKIHTPNKGQHEGNPDFFLHHQMFNIDTKHDGFFENVVPFPSNTYMASFWVSVSVFGCFFF